MRAQNTPNDLRAIAHQAMVDRGLEPDFPPEALQQLAGILGRAHAMENSIRDLRNLLWCSIDNDNSNDLDQLTVAEKLAAGTVKVLVAVADVDALVKPVSPIDRHARTNTTSVYTAAEIFPMLPERLSTNLTSLGEGEDPKETAEKGVRPPRLSSRHVAHNREILKVGKGSDPFFSSLLKVLANDRGRLLKNGADPLISAVVMSHITVRY